MIYVNLALLIRIRLAIKAYKQKTLKRLNEAVSTSQTDTLLPEQILG